MKMCFFTFTLTTPIPPFLSCSNRLKIQFHYTEHARQLATINFFNQKSLYTGFTHNNIG